MELKNAQRNYTLKEFVRAPKTFATLNAVRWRDLNNNRQTSTFSLYSKDQIIEFLKNPASNQESLRQAAIYIYNASSHFRRLIQYFAGLTDLSYIVSPYKINTSTAKPESLKKKYRKTLDILAAMDIKNQFRNILTVCLREDIYYGTMWVTKDNITLQQLPTEYCNIAVIEGNVLNVSFDFSYFDRYSMMLDLYPPEFREKYEAYKKDGLNLKWQELKSPTSFAIKCNTDILNYAIPPFVGVFREVYDLEDYKQLKMTKTELENYALLVMRLLVDDEGNWQTDYDKAVDFWRNLESVLPEEVGSVLSPMDIEKISFERTHANDSDTISDAEQQLFTSAGVSSLLFNNEKASSNALLLSIKADQAITFGIVKSIECAINRYLHSLSTSKEFKVTFLDCSPFNRKEVGDMYLKACQFGLPMVSYYCASQGLSQDEMDGMNFLEDDMLSIKERFKPLQSSSTQSSSSATGTQGRPKSDLGDLSDSGESSQENSGDE